MICGKSFSAHETATTYKRRYIKGIPRSHGEIIVIVPGKKASTATPYLAALPGILSTPNPHSKTIKWNTYYSNGTPKTNPCLDLHLCPAESGAFIICVDPTFFQKPIFCDNP